MMFGNWLQGLKNEHMRKSKKELADEVVKLQLHIQTMERIEWNIKHFKEMSEISKSTEVEKLKKEVERWKQKYSDELQKRVEFAELYKKKCGEQ